MQDIETDFLVVGAGPSGGALSCFLGEYGLSGIMIAAAAGTADTPRAHITNLSAMECLRDIALEKTCLTQATSSEHMMHTRWCASMAGEEHARVYAWGNDPCRHGDYAEASPCGYADLPQSSLEPIFIERAKSRGWDVRFSTTLLKVSDQGVNGILAEVKDNETNATYTIQSKYLFGCDGARSQVIRELALPLIKKPGGGFGLNIHVEADLTYLIKSRAGNLHWTFTPSHDASGWGQMVLVRMVHPWTEWIFSLHSPSSDLTNIREPTEEECRAHVYASIGDPGVSVRIISVSKWHINETVAETYSKGNVFCLGDAVHRHPPVNGLGSNTSIQDAYNLAWKIAYVARGQANPALLESYSAERQPVGVNIITRANDGLRESGAVWHAFGMMETTSDARTAAYNELQDPGPAGAQRRKMLHTAIRRSCRIYHALGTEMNQHYDENSNSAVYLDDEAGPRPSSLQDEDLILHYQQSTYPGSRLPHAWLNTRVPGEQISTQDLAGHGNFVLFTGVGGKGAWEKAAEQVEMQLKVLIKVHSIGWMQDWEDVYFDWERKREVDETGAVLVRPDRFVAWRAQTLDGAKNLVMAMKSVLRL